MQIRVQPCTFRSLDDIFQGIYIYDSSASSTKDNTYNFVTSIADSGRQTGSHAGRSFFLTLQALNLWLNASPVSTQFVTKCFYTGWFFLFFCFIYVLYSALLHLPSFRFHCVWGCWDFTQDCCDIVNWQSDILTIRLDLIHKVTFLFCQNWSIITVVGGEHSRKEPLEQLANSYSEHLHLWMNEWMNERTFYWIFYALGLTVL